MIVARAFHDWQEALPYGIGFGRKFVQAFPLHIDVESVVMEALWKAQLAGNVFTKTYVCIRVRGALRDEMRKVAEGQRRNYQDIGAFVSVDALDTLSAETQDPVEAIDRERLWEAMPRAATTMLERIAQGASFDDLADEYRVSPPRISQVLADIKARPTRPRTLPGHVDLRAELTSFARRELRRHIGTATSIGEIAKTLGVSNHTASDWAHGRVPYFRDDNSTLKPHPFRDALRTRALELVSKAFQRSKGNMHVAARLLSVSPMTAYRWGKRLPPEVVSFDRGGRRPDLPTTRFVELRAQDLSYGAIARELGVSKRTVAERLDRAQMVSHNRGGKRPDLPTTRFVELRAQGLSRRAIAVELGVSCKTVTDRLNKAKGLAKCGPLTELLAG